jgi:methionine biosynthesis protein MetW
MSVHTSPLRVDQTLIAGRIPSGARVLDVGCGNGALLHYLVHTKGVDGRGMELSQEGVNASVARGLSVVQGNADTDLADYPDGAFDYVVLSQTLQATFAPHVVLEQMARIGKRLIVSIPNFGYWRVRLQLLLRGRMPVTESLVFEWYDTPNIHFCTLKDFRKLCRKLDITLVEAMPLDSLGAALPDWQRGSANVLAAQAVFVGGR